jgi:hypothetical protein
MVSRKESGSTILGATYFEECFLAVSDTYADYLVETGAAR